VPTDQARPAAADLASFAALGAWYSQHMVGGNPPKVELHLGNLCAGARFRGDEKSEAIFPALFG
jgi:hypothetical protein